MLLTGTIQNGHVEPSEPLGLPEGPLVYIIAVKPITATKASAALQRIRARAVAVALPDEALETASLYED